MQRRQKQSPDMNKSHINRISILIFFSFIFTGIIILKLFQLEVVQADEYRKIADRNHQGNTELPARRGEIMIHDANSGEDYRLATNITLDLLYADPTLIEDKNYVVEKIAPLIYNAELAREEDKTRVADAIAKAQSDDELNQIKTLNDDELFEAYKKNIFEKISKEHRDFVILYTNPNQELREKVSGFGLGGIYLNENSIYANPTEISDPEKYARVLSPFLDIQVVKLKSLLIGKNRYVILAKKLKPEISEIIRELSSKEAKKFFGIKLREEYYRYYPEQNIGSQIVGFVDHTGVGQTGIEAFFDKELKGENGIFASQKDGVGNQITVGESVIKAAKDGDDIFLTIDRTIQLEVEKNLSQTVKNSKSDQGQAIVMDPKTGRILALAHYPTFNPNNFGEVFEKKDFNLDSEELKQVEKKGEENPQYFFYYNRDTDDKVELFPKKTTGNELAYQSYKNKVGPGAYRNRVVSDLYEPGSVFKIFTMAAGIDSNEVQPYSQVQEDGPIDVDFNVITKKYEHKIKNALDKYRGTINMTEVLRYSSNIGISYVSRKLGKELFYDYIMKFGFSKRTYISFLNEEQGQVAFYKNWSESDHLTHGFGQGITATPIQVITGLAAIANGGIMMQPKIVDEVRQKTEIGTKAVKNDSKILGRSVKKETADTITAMLVKTVDEGIPQAKIASHYLAGKTGTSQTYKNGRPLSGIGTTIATMGAYGPVNDPKFVILIKLDKPRTEEWGSTTAAPFIRETAKFLYEYYNIPPDRN